MKYIKTYELFDKWLLPSEMRQLSNIFMQFIRSCIDKKYKVFDYALSKKEMQLVWSEASRLDIYIKMHHPRIGGYNEKFIRFISLYYNHHRKLIVMGINNVESASPIANELKEIGDFLISKLAPIDKKYEDIKVSRNNYWIGKDDLEELKREITKENYLFWKNINIYNL